MRPSPFDYIGNLDTLLAVMIGALLATLGALVTELIQERLGRKRRQREAARFFGEILPSVNEIFDLASESRKVGEPWGIYTQKLFETAAREGDIYLRNRERLFDIREMALRFDIHAHRLRLTVPIANIVQQGEKIEAIQARLDENAALDVRAASPAILKRLEPLAGIALKER